MDATFTGQQIATHRKKLGLTQKELAEQLHVTDKAVSKWERGINFPDLGLMESLAHVLNTTPAALLGLEDAGQDETISSITEISNTQAAQSHRDIRQAGWIHFGAAALLVIAYLFFGRDVRKTQIAYQILHGVILLFVCYGGYLLFKYGEIKKWDIQDWIACYCFAIPVLIFLAFQFFTGHNPNLLLELVLIAIASGSIQLLFHRIMRPVLIKAIPLIVTAAFALWHTWQGTIGTPHLCSAMCCLLIWLLCKIKK